MEVAAGKNRRRLSRGRLAWYVLILAFSAVFMYFAFARHMRFFLVPSSSMEPALRPADYILTLNETAYERGDIVVLNDPLRPGEYDVKRIVAVGGDTVSSAWGGLRLNGLYASEPYINEPMKYNDITPYTVPDGEIFVLGDNRNESEDSSVWEQKSIAVREVVGRVKLIYLPSSRWQFVAHYPLVNSAGE